MFCINTLVQFSSLERKKKRTLISFKICAVFSPPCTGKHTINFKWPKRLRIHTLYLCLYFHFIFSRFAKFGHLLLGQRDILLHNNLRRMAITLKVQQRWSVVYAKQDTVLTIERVNVFRHVSLNFSKNFGRSLKSHWKPLKSVFSVILQCP